MTRKENGGRHGSAASSGAESWRSQDTVKGVFAGGQRRATPVSISTDQQAELDLEISPRSVLPAPSTTYTNTSNLPSIAPWETASNADLYSYRKDLAVLESSGGRVPSISRQPPTAISPTSYSSYWTFDNTAGPTPSSTFGSRYTDSNDDVAQHSPSFRPGNGNEDMGFPRDDRRPSVASATTISSTGSKSSIGPGFRKKLQGFFGDEYSESRQNSETSLPPGIPSAPTDQSAQRVRNRKNSVHNTVASTGSRPTSPSSSRPRTPLALSEVTPWEYQGSKEMPASTDDLRYSSDQQRKPSKASGHHHKFHLSRHRHSKSKDEPKTSELVEEWPTRPKTGRENSYSGVPRADYQFPSAMSSAMNSRTMLPPRPSSPTPSMNSTMTRDFGTPKSSGAQGSGGKRSLLDKLRRRDKPDRSGSDTLKDMPSSAVSPTQRASIAKLPKIEPVNKKVASGAESVSSQRGQGGVVGKEPTSKKDHSLKPFRTRRGYSTYEGLPAKDPNMARADTTGNEALWNLDTDLSHMEGIVDTRQPPMTPPVGEIYAGWPGEDVSQTQKEPEPTGAWDAPDSWAVKRVVDDNIGRLRELDDTGALPQDEDPGPPYCVRIFRADSTFAVLSLSLNTTVSEIVHILGKKSYLQDELGNYQIVMRKHDTARQLEPSERPLVIQRRLLELAGYTESDRLEDVGREDNSYLCRFTFLPSKMSGFSSLERDPGFSKMQKFNHIDLAGRNLITIPIALYQKATEIISLNLSRNLSLDVPKDFIQACTNLRDIKYTSNDAWRLPPAFSLASRLTYLDVSNNRLEQLEHAELHKLHNLISLKLSNNRLTQLPKYFAQWRALRTLNISSNSLSEFPEFLSELKSLVDLDISFNSISSMSSIGGLTSLERLWATNNKLSGSFPSTVGNLNVLREVDIRFNSLQNIDVLSSLPQLDCLLVGHNSVSAFEGPFSKLRILHLNHNPVTRFAITNVVPTLTQLNLASAKLSQLPDDLYQNVPNLTKLNLDKNHFVSISPHAGKLSKLEHLSIAKNLLSNLPAEIGRLIELRYLDVRENNLNQLPAEIWYARKLETLNVSSNVLDSFPKPGAPMPTLPDTANGTPATTPGLSLSPSFEELGKLEDFAARRPSTASGMFSMGSSPGGNAYGRGSISSAYGTAAANRKASVISRATTDGTMTPISRKDSSLSNKIMATFAGSLRYLFLADNRLTDDAFDELALLPELRLLNISYNLIYDVPPRTIRRWQHLTELYLSGNDLSSLPAEDFEAVSSLKVLHINCNKFQVLPAELAKVQKLAVLDVGSNLLRYNVCNWPYDWNWNWNPNLRYLNMSGNKRLEIKPSGARTKGVNGRDGTDLTDFTSLPSLRVLGLMDVTLMVPSVPDQSEDRRVRTSGSSVGSMSYGMADALGRNEHLSTMDLVIPRFRSHDDEKVIGMFDGQALSSGGSKIAKYLYENFKNRFSEELDRLRGQETAEDALRRTYLGLNKDLATLTTASQETKGAGVHRGSIAMPELGEEDLKSGSAATVLFLKEMDLFVSNVGDAQALLIQSEGGHRMITRKHDPAEASERHRIKEAGGFVSRQGKLNDTLEISRAFGYIHMVPSVIAAPYVSHIQIKESDEMVLLASRELWDYLTPDFAVDVARSERGDLMRAAQKLRDLAIAFGATGKIMVMVIGVSDLRKKERARYRTHSMSMGPSGSPDEFFAASRRGKRGRDAVADSKLARLDQEVEAPTGDVSLVFTDIKNSTMLWETYPIAMRSAIKMHNEVMRRQLRIIGGYEVKTEGDAFMVAFPTVTSALLWCFTVQMQLLDVPWPQEILDSVNGQEVLDADGNVIFRGLSVRMGVHWGQPVCEVDPVTKRMDYFGPMVNRAARISAVADGGQITVSSDFIAEIQRLLETHIESDRSGSTGSEETLEDDMISRQIRRELRSLSSQGFEVKDLGERRLKGLENPEYIYLMYPHALATRLVIQQQRAEAEEQAKDMAGGNKAMKMRNSQFTVEIEDVWDLWNLSLRLEMLCSTLENPGSTALKPPETALLERMKSKGGEVTDRFLLNFFEHQISRIETCITTLALRNLVHPFKHGMLQHACPMADIFSELTAQLSELQAYKTEAEFAMAPT